MNAQNFDDLMMETAKNNAGKRLLLHCCCAPCSSACLKRLKEYFKITVLFYNPNIENGEYQKRKGEIIRFLKETGWADFLDCDYDEEQFYSAVKGLENCPEGGERCEKCFYLRLKKTAEIANEGGFDFFTTTLTVSPHKNAALINEIGEKLGGERFLHCDFKKRNGYKESCELSKKYGLYRQNFCGCVFSHGKPSNA